MEKILPSAFCLVHDNLTNQLRSEVTISIPGSNRKVTCMGIWDTGANMSGITTQMVQQLKLEGLHAGFANVVSPLLKNKQERRIFTVSLLLENAIEFQAIKVHENEQLDEEENGILIGMDIINQGNFVVSNQGGECLLNSV